MSKTKIEKDYPHLAYSDKYQITRTPVPWLYILVFALCYYTYPMLIEQPWFDRYKFVIVFTEVQYLLLSLMYYFMDQYRYNNNSSSSNNNNNKETKSSWYDFWSKFKIRSIDIEPITYRDMLPQVIFNRVFFICFNLFIFRPYIDRGVNIDQPRPSVLIVLWEIFVYVFFYDLAFYYGHRTLHSSSLFPHVHYKHHETKGTICIAGW